ncbi:amine dehydrogenase large subunit [Limnohabitans sp. T6-5]|uniref:amine dehydrogenase large subunit n=1 Tax=Limnohabitans sp. T6-5 TaxID=1100724 RepID=UPI001304F651|nr:amine dehydrogenase large subunit [Limnohabitans sp. T6-5]
MTIFGASRARPSMGVLSALAGSLIFAASAHAATAQSVPPELPAETLTVTSLADAPSTRVYVADVAISHIVDGRIRVFDATQGRFLGMISTGFAGNFTLSAKADELYVATTYYSRGTRGERTDVLEVHDTRHLAPKFEVQLPPRRAQALNYRGLVRATGSGRFVLVQNATPATSITVVDLVARQVVNEIQTPGCWGTLPAANGNRFAMLCGDGKVATVTLSEQGQVTDRQVSEKLFDADTDAWFHHAEQVGDRYWFVSFLGQLTELDLSGPVARVVRQQALVNAADRKAGWRPGGYQNFAVDPGGRWLVAGMHPKGAEGSHKSPAAQLWVFDLQSGQRVAKYPGKATASLTFSRNGERLQALDGMTGAMNVWRWQGKGKLTHLTTVAKAGEAALHIESHD